MANFVQALVGTYVAGAGVAQSGYATFSFVLSQELEGWVPVVITNPNTTSISAGAEVELFRSTDYGGTYETVGTVRSVFPRPASAGLVQRKDVLITPGWFLIAVQVGGGVASTWTAQLGTAWVITALE
jgi:hypothetical protein